MFRVKKVVNNKKTKETVRPRDDKENKSNTDYNLCDLILVYLSLIYKLDN